MAQGNPHPVARRWRWKKAAMPGFDGRSIYTPLFAGIFWEEADTVLEDIDRIEVIRGPGAALWGANAVNGVINISTKSARDTQGVLLSGSGGVEERGFGAVRYGGRLGTNAYELGYRVMVHPRFTVDCAAFYNDYDRLKSIDQSPIELRLKPDNQPYLLVPLKAGNEMYGEGYGAELAVTWQPWDGWRVRANYSFLDLELHTRGPSPSAGEGDEGLDPKHQVKLGSDIDLGRQVEWGLGWRYVSREPFIGVPSYTELDTRLAWKPVVES